MIPDPSRRPIEQWAFLLVFLFVASIPAENGVSIPGVGSVSKVLGLLALGATLLSTVDRGWMRLRAPAAWLVFAAAYVAWNVASFFWSRAPSDTWGEIVTIVQLLGMAWMLWQVTDVRGRLDALFAAFVLGNYLAIGAVLVGYLGAGAEVDFREVGAFNPNGFAIIASLAIPMAWRLATASTNAGMRLLAAVYPALAFVAVLLAASRGGLLVFLVALSVLVTGSMRLTLARRAALLATVVLLAWGGFHVVTQVVPFWDQNVARLLEVDEQLQGGTFTGRRDIWSAGLTVFAESPVIGVGAGAFEEAVATYLGAAKPAHNALIAIATGTGVIGLALFLATLGFALLSAAADVEGRPYQLVLAAALLVAILPTNSESDKFMWFVLCALGCARPMVWVPGAPVRRPAARPAPVGPRG